MQGRKCNLISQNLSFICPSNLDQALGDFFFQQEGGRDKEEPAEKNKKLACKVGLRWGSSMEVCLSEKAGWPRGRGPGSSDAC